MSLQATLKARKAVACFQKGDTAEALKLYGEAVAAGLDDMRSLLSYSVLLIRNGEYQQARELIVKIQKQPASPEQRQQLFVNYAACMYKLGELDKGLELLERQHAHAHSGLIYQTLGYLYVEKGDAEKALAYNKEAVEYDDEDPICLDNLAQTYYRLLDDKAAAKPLFEKAHQVKPTQIDTLYFLAQYDLEAGDKAAAKEKLEKALEGRCSPLNYATAERIHEVLDTL